MRSKGRGKTKYSKITRREWRLHESRQKLKKQKEADEKSRNEKK